MPRLLLIAIFGGLGSISRYLLAGFTQNLSGAVFPYGALAVNVLGCFLIGIMGALMAGPFVVREEYRFALMVGFLGGFTTFSTFGLETFALINDGQMRLAMANIAASNGLGLLAVWLGYRLMERIAGA